MFKQFFWKKQQKKLLQNGFTLVELLVSISILIMLFAIGVPTYLFLSRNVKQASYENKIKYIENAAANYGNDTGENAVYVDTLAKTGYIYADNENNDVLDPRDNSLLNCYIVNINYENNNYYGYFMNEQGISEDGKTCDMDRLNSLYLNVQLSLHKSLDENGNTYQEDALLLDQWAKENLVLVANVKDELKENIVEITFTSNGFQEKRTIHHNFESNNKLLISASQILNADYTVQVRVAEKDQNGNIGEKIYAAKIRVKIDKQSPIIYTDEVNIDHAGEWSGSYKKTTAVASDLNGSGVYGYYIHNNKSSSCETNRDAYIVSDGMITENLDSGTYSLCVMDQVGNVSEVTEVNVVKVDTTSPEIEIVNPFENQWTNAIKANETNKPYSISCKAKEEESGLAYWEYSFDGNSWEKYINSEQNDFSTPNMTEEREGNIFIRACDKVGNCSEIKQSMIKIDNTNPEIHYSLNPGTYSKAQTVNITVNDNHFSHMKVDVLKNGEIQNQLSIAMTKENKYSVNLSTSAIWTINTTAYDLAQNSTSVSMSYTIELCSYNPGTVWQYGYTGGSQGFSVPCNGVYQVTVAGAQGGTGDYASNAGRGGNANAGNGGNVYTRTAKLSKGLGLSIVVGDMPQVGSVKAREGYTSPKKDYITNYYNNSGYKIGEKVERCLADNSSRCQSSYTVYRGWPDGNFGQEDLVICDNTSTHGGGAVGGGGGGSSYISISGSKVFSAKGGVGGSASFKAIDGSGSVSGGAGGGDNITGNNVSGCTWTGNLTSSSNRGGNGYVKITLDRLGLY